jgi:hypothetical protein
VTLVSGTALHCSRFGCIVRLADGRLGNLSPSQNGHDIVRKSVLSGKRERFDFVVDESEGRLRLSLAPGSSPSLDEKIIDYLRQTAEWDPSGTAGAETRRNEPDRLQPFEVRARRQYRDSPERPPRKKH